MDSLKIFRELVKINPETKAIISSNFIENHIINNFRKYGFCTTLIKPYGLEELHKVLREVFNPVPCS